MPRLDLVGKRFGALEVVEVGPQDSKKRYMWVCRCDCGNEKAIHGRHLVNGKTRTCGCKTGIDLPKPALGLKGERHPRWKGGRFVDSRGYAWVYMGDGKYIQEHRMVTGTSDPSVVVHHKNHVKADNRLENLEPMTRRDHAIEHALGSAVGSGQRLTKAMEGEQ